MENLRIGYFYPELLNLYGDNGNVEILKYRTEKRDISVSVVNVGINTQTEALKEINLVFMGGGPDSKQKEMYEDLTQHKAGFLKKFIESGGVGLFICGAYQLLGHYYKTADGSVLTGLGIFDLHTQHFGKKFPRCTGNVVCEINDEVRNDPVLGNISRLSRIGTTLVGFENHGGRTYLGSNVRPFARVLTGFGNNGEDKTEGVVYKNAIGSYLHGPILSKNPHLADFLIAKALSLDTLPVLDDNLVEQAHSASKKLRK